MKCYRHPGFLETPEMEIKRIHRKTVLRQEVFIKSLSAGGKQNLKGERNGCCSRTKAKRQCEKGGGRKDDV